MGLYLLRKVGLGALVITIKIGACGFSSDVRGQLIMHVYVPRFLAIYAISNCVAHSVNCQIACPISKLRTFYAIWK